MVHPTKKHPGLGWKETNNCMDKKQGDRNWDYPVFLAFF
jgi:hypothetical protein